MKDSVMKNIAEGFTLCEEFLDRLAPHMIASGYRKIEDFFIAAINNSLYGHGCKPLDEAFYGVKIVSVMMPTPENANHKKLTPILTPILMLRFIDEAAENIECLIKESINPQDNSWIFSAIENYIGSLKPVTYEEWWRDAVSMRPTCRKNIIIAAPSA